ncbi:WD40 repeat domain-containing protein [uncultured Methanofollis sp.]|uniref:WD40 repeat domain-containing protein n=1 Tax=uncultured Methanofollis sp. TaxID=262500 RepID=UPI002623F565|nr:PQQ-binding-like beta-propeller repeat protein [uncultured Methanofollis sp.]
MFMGLLQRIVWYMRFAVPFLLLLLLLVLPAGALAETPLWTYSAPAEVADLSLTPDGSHVLIGGERLCLLSGNGTPLWAQWSAEMTASSADGRLIAGASGLQLTLYTRDASILWRVDMPSDCVALALSPEGKRLVVADLVGTVYFYDTDGTRRAKAETRGDPDDEEAEVQSQVHAIAISGKGTYIAVASSRGLFYYTGTGRKVWAREGALEGGTAVAVSGTGDEVAVASDAGVRLLNRTGSLLWTHMSHRPVTTLALSEDGSRVLAGAQDNTLICIDREGKTLWTFTADGWIRDVAVSKDGSRILAGSMDRQAYLFDGDGHLLEAYTLGGWVNHVALTPDGTQGVASASRQVIGISTPSQTPAPTTEIPTPSQTPAPTRERPIEVSPPAGVPLLLLACLLVGSVTLGASYLRRHRREVPQTREEAAPAEVGPEGAEETPAPLPWEGCLREGKIREAARIIEKQMTTLIEESTETRLFCIADALEACPGQRERLAAFFAEADRLAYARDVPKREEVEALAAAYLRLAGEIRPPPE